MLDRNIELELTFESGTADLTDFNATDLVYVFEAGSTTGASQCNTVAIASDGVVEDTEELTVTLRDSLMSSDVEISRSEAEVVIEDSPSDCKQNVCTSVLLFFYDFFSSNHSCILVHCN